MDRRSWLWRRKSSEKSPSETESSGSLSSHSERLSDDQMYQEVTKTSPNHLQLLEVSSNISGREVHENVKSLTEKLSAAISNINAKEELVKQHAKVAEEAVSGWEKAESEVIVLKQQLESTAQKNSALEDRVSHLDGALKECLRQLRQSREEQEQKAHEAITKKTREWESVKLEFERQLAEVQSQLFSAKANAAAANAQRDLQLKLETVEKEYSALKLELYAQSEELKVRTLERDHCAQAAEIASKQYLVSIKKVAKLEAQCRKLQAVARKVLLVDQKSVVTPNCVESTDCQSESGVQLLSLEADVHKIGGAESNEYEPSFSDSLASALIAEFDQIKIEKSVTRSFSVVSPDIGLMDDFLEMERLASMDDMGKDDFRPELATSEGSIGRNYSNSKSEIEALTQKIAKLEDKLQKLEVEKAGLEQALTEIQYQLETSRNQLKEAEQTSAELRRQLTAANESKQAIETDLESTNGVKKDLESQLEAKNVEVQTLRSKVGSLELEVKEEWALSMEIETRCHKLQDELSMEKHETELRKATSFSEDMKIKQEKDMAVAFGKLVDCQKTIASLGQQLKALATLEDFLLDTNMPELLEISTGPRELRKSNAKSNDTYIPKTLESSNSVSVTDKSPNCNDRESPPSSSSSSSTNQESEKSRHGFRKLFSQSKNSSGRLENE